MPFCTGRVSAAGSGQPRFLPVRTGDVQLGGKQGGSGAQRDLLDHPLKDLEVGPVRRPGNQPVGVGRDLRPDRRREVPPSPGTEACLSLSPGLGQGFAGRHEGRYRAPEALALVQQEPGFLDLVPAQARRRDLAVDRPRQDGPGMTRRVVLGTAARLAFRSG